ncbi:MAG TPA: AI-2E family transporter [Lacipirellulaceae bacterium]|nr:AI-2E family transporter [Lacipirellulaceae bacterium]
MPRVISFFVLLAIVLLVGAIFFQVMAQFFVPLFLASVLLVVFAPLHRWIGNRLPQWPRTAAMLTTISIILVVVLPLVWLGWKAYVDFDMLLSKPAAEQPVAAQQAVPTAAKAHPTIPAIAASPSSTSDSAKRKAAQESEQVQLTQILKGKANEVVRSLAARAGAKIDVSTIEEFVDWASGFAAKIVVTGVQSVIGVVISLFILVIALYYFLADGPAMVEAVMAVSPLDRRYEHELLQRFAEVSRAVVVATLLSALAQGALAGIGYVFALPEQAPIFLLMALTTAFALIPIFGAFAVWGLVCVVLFAQGHVVAAVSLAIYCTLVVSLIDNIMKPLILHGQSKLHPLLALLSILGGIEAFGPVGILVGPMLVSFLQALLNMLRKELDEFGGPVGTASKPLAESMVEAIHLATAEGTTGNATTPVQLAANGGDSTSSKKPQPSAKSTAPRRAKRKR